MVAGRPIKGTRSQKYWQDRAEKRKKANELHDNHKKLIDHYFACGFNKTEACRRMGYSQPDKYSWIVFNKPKVKAEVERRKARLEKKYELSREWIEKRLMILADAPFMLAKFKKVNADGQIEWDFTGATEEELAVITELQIDTFQEGSTKKSKFKINIGDPKGALETLAKLQGLFKEQVEIKVEESTIERLNAARKRAFAKQEEAEQPDGETDG